MIRWLAIAVALAACSSDKKATPGAGSASAAAAGPTEHERLTGPLPPGPEGDLARTRCVICHAEDYLVQQRLSPEGWKKVVGKMQKFGAPLDDTEAAALATWLATLYTPDLPMRPDKLVPTPASGLPD